MDHRVEGRIELFDSADRVLHEVGRGDLATTDQIRHPEGVEPLRVLHVADRTAGWIDARAGSGNDTPQWVEGRQTRRGQASPRFRERAKLLTPDKGGDMV